MSVAVYPFAIGSLACCRRLQVWAPLGTAQYVRQFAMLQRRLPTQQSKVHFAIESRHAKCDQHQPQGLGSEQSKVHPVLAGLEGKSMNDQQNRIS
eukprot:241546-Karenia_brevis.AAC.1